MGADEWIGNVGRDGMERESEREKGNAQKINLQGVYSVYFLGAPHYGCATVFRDATVICDQNKISMSWFDLNFYGILCEDLSRYLFK